MRSDFYSLPWAAQMAIRRGERNAHAASARLHTIEELQATIAAQSDTITRLQAALERIGKRKLGGPFRGGQVVSERREMIEIAREALRSSVGGE